MASTLALAAAIYLVISLLVQTVRVEGASMSPTLGSGDVLLANRVSYRFGDPARGDIVVFHPPDDPSRTLIKRVIGIPGDVLEIDGRYADAARPGSPSTAILVKPDGGGPWQRLDEPYLPEPWTTLTFCCRPDGRAVADAPAPITIPPTEYLLLGDNRNQSRDSRDFGLVPRGNVVGSAWVRLWPLSRLGSIGPGPHLVAAALLVVPLRRRLSGRSTRW